MTFKNYRNIPPEYRQKIIILVILVVAPILTWGTLKELIPYLSTKLSTLKTNEIIAGLAVIVGVYTLAIKLIFYVFEQHVTTERQIKLEVTVKEKLAIVSCTVENQGNKRIKPQNVYLFVDKGILEDNVYDFPYLLKHEHGEYDCNLAKRCKAGGIESYPVELIADEHKNQFSKSIRLQHLSAESVLYIDPGESFSEDVVLELDTGIYRVMTVWTAVKADCICATKQFVIL